MAVPMLRDRSDAELAPKHQNYLSLGLAHNSSNYLQNLRLIKTISGSFRTVKILGLAKENLDCGIPPNIKLIDF